jgi:UDP-glucose 4-epimerase
MLDVIENVTRVAGVDFKAELAPRREGDPAEKCGRLQPSPHLHKMAAAFRRLADHSDMCRNAIVGTQSPRPQ